MRRSDSGAKFATSASGSSKDAISNSRGRAIAAQYNVKAEGGAVGLEDGDAKTDRFDCDRKKMVPARQLILSRLVAMQDDLGFQLIRSQEIEIIKRIWSEDHSASTAAVVN